MPTEEQVAAAEARIVEHSKRIEFYLTEYSVELLAAKMDNGDFEIPAYQREDTWEPARKSRFVESLLMGLPIHSCSSGRTQSQASSKSWMAPSAYGQFSSSFPESLFSKENWMSCLSWEASGFTTCRRRDSAKSRIALSVAS